MNFVTPTSKPVPLDVLESRYALRVAARLTENAEAVGPDIAERLRFAREQALQRAAAGRAAARSAQAEPALVVASVSRSGAAMLGTGPSSWWLRLASVVPLLALVVGLMMIERYHANSQISAAAEIDAALLADDLPPRAYSDEGFLEFLKAPNN